MPLLVFRKSYVKAHQRRLKNGQVITIPAHYDKRTKKGAEAALAHGHDLRHLDEAKRAVFEKMHAEQHLLHHYHAHALRQRVDEQAGHLEGLAKQVAAHRAAGRHVDAAKVENQRLRLYSRHRVNQRELDDIEQRLAGLAGMKEAMVQGSGAIDASTADSHKAYAAKLGERFKARAKPEPKPAAQPFTPTHELSDGTPVRATDEKGVYTDASGAEIEDDYAKPIKAGKQEAHKPAADKPKQEGHSRAPVGGGLGANGEWYEGGKFINTVPENAKGKAKANKATGKQEIEPRVWAVAPEEGMRSIWARWGSVWGKDRDGKLYVRQDLSAEYAPSHILELAQQDLDRYNAGERWYRPEAKEAPKPVDEATKPSPQLSSWDRDNLVTWVVAGKPTLFLHQKSKGLWDTLSPAVQDSIERSAERKRQDNAAIRQQATDNANREGALYQSVKTKLLAGNELTDSEIEGLGLRVKGAAFAYLSPTVQRLFGISKMKVREAMGSALKPSYSDFGAKTWVADPRKALANAAAWVNKANGPQEGDTKSENGANYVLRDGRWHRVEQQHEASKDGPDSPAKSATTGTTGSQARDQAPAGGAVSFDVLKGQYSAGSIAALDRRAQENHWPESFVSSLSQGLASLPQEIRDYFDHQAAMGNDVLIRHIANLDEIPAEFRGTYRNAAAMTVNGMRIEFIEDRFPSINSLRHELVHYAWAGLYGSDQRPGAGRAVVDEVLADVAADGEKILKWATSKATTKDVFQQIEADSLVKKLRRFKRDQKAGKDVPAMLKSGVELELMVGGYKDAAKAVLPTVDADGQYATVAVYMAIAKRLGVTMSGEFAKEEGVAYRCGEDEATAKKVFGSIAQANERRLVEKNEPKIHDVVPELGVLSVQVSNLKRGINFYTDPEGSRQKQAEIQAIEEGPMKKVRAQYGDALRAYAAQHPGWYDTSGDRPWLRQTKEEAPKPAAAAPKPEATGPQEGDTKSENGIDYVLKDGRWHRTTADVTDPEDDVVDAKAKSDQHRQAITDTLTGKHGWKASTNGYLEKTFQNVRPRGQADITTGTWLVQINGPFANILRGNDKQASILLADNAKPADLAAQIDQAVNVQVDKERVARGLKPEAKAPEAKAPVAPETITDDLDPSSPNYRYRDTGYVGGSRKELAAAMLRTAKRDGRQVRKNDIDWETLESNPREAKEVITKSHLFGTVDWEGLKAQGLTPGAGFIMDRVYASVGTGPRDDTPQARQDYALGLETLRNRLEVCRTPEEIEKTLAEIKEERDGVNLNSEEAARYQELDRQAEAAYAPVHAYQRQEYAHEKAVGIAHRVFYAAESPAGHRRGGKYTADQQADLDRALAGVEAAKAAQQAFIDAHPEMQRVSREVKTARGIEVTFERPDETEWRRIRQQQDVLVAVAKARNQVESPMLRAWSQLGERFNAVLDHRTSKGSDTFLNHLATAKLGRIKDWSWQKTGGTKAPRQVTEEGKRFQLQVADSHERVGGRSVPVASTADLKERFGLREVQSGNWVLRDPVSAKFHTEQTAGALSDLADILGITDQQVAMNGRVALAFGARGTGNAGGVAARAHYEPVGRVINLTKMGGGGCLAHEWLHGLDNLLLESQGGTAGADDFLTRQPSLLPPGPLRNAFQGLQDALKTGQHRIKQRLIYTPEHYRQAQQNIARTHMPEGMRDYGLPNAARIIKEARDVSTALDKLEILYEPLITRGQRGAKKHLADWRNVALAYHGGQPEGGSLVVETGKPQSAFAMEAVKLDNGAAGKYWSRTEELAARAFQSYVEDKLASQGRRNDYLSAKADNQYYRLDGTAPFPEGEERTRINAAFDKLIAAMQADNSLAKALARTRYPRRLVVFRKSYVHGHYRKNPKTGEMVWVESYSDKRTTRQGQTLFAHDLHRQDHFKQNLAEGRLREAMHSFHDLDHDAAHKLAGTLGLHNGVKHADKKELMRAVRGKVLQQQQDYQNQVKAQEDKAKGKGQATKPAAKPEVTPAPPTAEMDMHAVMDSAEKHLGTESTFEIFDHLPQRTGDNPRWSKAEMYRAIMAIQKERKADKHGKAKQALLAANGGSPLGIEAKKPDSNRHALILPDASSPGKYRYSAYDEHGFYTHATHDTADQALDEAVKEGFTEHAPGSLDRLSQTDTWAQGMKRAEEAQAGWKAPAKAPESPPEAPAAKTTDHLFDQEAHGPQVRYHVTAAGAAIAKEGFKPMTTGGVGVAGGTDGHTFTYRDRQDAKNLLDDLNNMEAVRVAPDPIAVAAKLTGMSQEAIRKTGDRFKAGWDQHYRKKLGGRDSTDRDVALYVASNYVPFESFASVTGPRRAFGIVPVDVSKAQRIGGEKDGEERWDPATIKPILSKQAAQMPPAVTQPDPEDQVLDINGAEVPYAWKLVDAEDLAPTSEKADNQFRDRTRAASDEQVASMAANLKFRLLSDSPLMDYGAPVLAKDGKTIIGGNGRSLAIRRAYGMGQADGYQQDLAKRAARFGIDPAAVAKMKAPVLVRVLQQDVDIKQAAIASNEGGGARMSALEQARVDGERLGDLSDFEADEEGNFNTRANLPFIRRFLSTMPVAQRSAFQSADGGLSQEGISRLRNAVLYRAYGDSDVLSRLVESADPAQRNVLSALTRAAPTVAQASADVKAGNLHDLDVSADIVAATTLLAQVRGEGKFGSVDEYLNQQNLFGDPLSDATKIILKHFDRNLRSSKAMAGFLTDYYAAVRQIGDPKQMGMFADATPDKPTLLRQTDAQRQNAPSPQAALF